MASLQLIRIDLTENVEIIRQWVDSMGVITKLDTEDVRKALHRYFCLDILSMTPTVHGISDTAYIIEEGNKSYLLKIYENKAKEDIANEINFLNTLYHGGFSVPRPISFYKEEHLYIFDLLGKKACLFTMINGDIVKMPTHKHVAQIGSFMGRLHQFTHKQRMKRNLYTSDRLLYYIDRCQRGLFDDYTHIMDDVNTHESDGVIHGDLFPDNAHFMNNHLTGVFDFTGACSGSFYFDLAVVAMSWCFEENHLSKDSLDSLIQHYLEASPIQNFTYQRFIKWMKYGALYYGAQRCYMSINRPNQLNGRDYEKFIQKIDSLGKLEGHGGDIYSFAKKSGSRVEEIIDFSSNINFVKSNVNIDLNGLNLLPYPDSHYKDLRNAFNGLYSIPGNCDMEFYNGASAGIFSLFRSLKPENCILYAPIYSEYKKAADLFASKTILVNRLDNLYHEPAHASFIVFVHPSTPDGKVYPIESLLQHWKNKASHILIDESFLDFIGAPSVVPLLEEYPSLYVLKSMSKFYSGAGIRVGAVISNRENIRVLRSHEPMWKLSSFDTRYVIDILKDTDFIHRTKELTATNSKLLIQILEESGIFEKIFDSQANFVLAKLKDLNGHDLQDRLADHRILIRVCDNFDFLDSSYIRFAVKRQEDLESLERALKCLL